MARKLPWATESTADTKPSRAVNKKTVQLKRERPATPEVDKDQDGEHHDVHIESPRKQRKRATSRSSSTSPPPGPPEVEVMRDGYEADDAFVMVEDEFNSVAQSFTAHLHHAEYKRLLRQAQQAPPKNLPDMSPSMSHEVKQRLRREKLRTEQRSGLQSIGVTASGGVDALGDDGVDETRIDDPWTGTSLAGLMATGGQHKTSLIGLERMPSYTRAARGYDRGPTSNTTEFHQEDQAKGASSRTKRLPAMKATADDDEDDSKARSKSRSNGTEASTRQPHRSLKDGQRGLEVISKNATRADNNSSTIKGMSKTKPMFTHSFLHDLDDSDNDLSSRSPPPPAQSHRPTLVIKKKEKEKQDKKSRFDEVPMFLI